MKTHEEFEQLLLDLRQEDIDRDHSEVIDRFSPDIPGAEKRLRTELNYLRLVNEDKVDLPDDLYFARTREKIRGRVTIRRVSMVDRIVALIIPETIRPLPGFSIAAAVAAVVILAVIFFPGGQPSVTDVAYEQYVPLGDRYITQISKSDGGSTLPAEYRENLEILLKAVAIIGSPSSLSRSQAFRFGLK